MREYVCTVCTNRDGGIERGPAVMLGGWLTQIKMEM